MRFKAGVAVFLMAGSLVSSATYAEVPEEEREALVNTVREGLASEDVGVRSWAVRAAGLIGEREFRTEFDAGTENAEAAVRIASAWSMLTAGYHERQARELLVTEIVEGDAPTRTVLLTRILPSLDDEHHVAVLEDALEGISDLSALRQVTDHLARFASGHAYEVLDRVDEVPADQRAVYVDSIANAGRPEGCGIAESLIDSRNADLHADGARIAIALNTAECREHLDPLLASTDAGLAQRVGFHLARFGNVDALGRVKDLALNPEMPEDSRMAALTLLRDSAAHLLSFDEISAVVAEDGRSDAFVERAYETMGATQSAEALTYLRGLVDGMFADERMNGLAGIGYSGDGSDVALVQSIVSNPGEEALRMRAARALGNLGGDEAAAHLSAALRRARSESVRGEIIRALARTGSAEAVQPITWELSSRTESAVLAAVEALAEIGDPNVASQIESVATNNRSPIVRWKATVVLATIDEAAGRIRLLQMLDRLPEGWEADVAGLSQPLQDEIDVQLLRHSNPGVRDAALMRVRSRPDGGLAVMREMVVNANNIDIRRQAIATVTAAGDRADAQLFQQLTTDPERSIRFQGYAALAELGDPANAEFFGSYLASADATVKMIATYATLRMHAD